MNYIINPMWFYWINVVDELNTIFFVISATLAATIVVLVIISAMSYWLEEGYGVDDSDFKTMKPLIKPLIICGIVLAVALAGTVFIPSKNALIEMQVAKFATHENAEWTVEAVKSAVDYVVDAITKVNGG